MSTPDAPHGRPRPPKGKDKKRKVKGVRESFTDDVGHDDPVELDHIVDLEDPELDDEAGSPAEFEPYDPDADDEPDFEDEDEFDDEELDEFDDEEPDFDEDDGFGPAHGPGHGPGPRLAPGPKQGPGHHPGPPHEHGPGPKKHAPAAKKAGPKKAPGPKKVPGPKKHAGGHPGPGPGPEHHPPHEHGPRHGRGGPAADPDFGFGPGFGRGFEFGPGPIRGRQRGFGRTRRGRRGDVRAAILTLLAERPMHGYEMIKEIAERSHDVWRPSPGSVYPTLQMLGDEGLIDGSESVGKKRLFELTDEGRAAAAKITTPPWAGIAENADQGQVDLRTALGQLFGAVAQSAYSATVEQQQRIFDILTKARRAIYSMLADSD